MTMRVLPRMIAVFTGILFDRVQRTLLNDTLFFKVHLVLKFFLGLLADVLVGCKLADEL